MAPTDTQRGLAGFGFLATKAVAFGAIPASIWYYSTGDTLKAIYWILLSLVLGMASHAFVLDDPEGDAEYAAAILQNQASQKK
jgi:hypothetical protein